MPGADYGVNGDIYADVSRLISHLITTATDAFALSGDLEVAVRTYMHAHDLYGDGDIRTGRAWDKMRKAMRMPGSSDG
jgi:hypothetical protein